MRWREALHPVSMQRVAVLAPRSGLRAVLVDVADEGTVELDTVISNGDRPATATPAAMALQRVQARASTRRVLSPSAPDLDGWERDGRVDLIAGEAELEQHAAQAITRGEIAALAGWMPSDRLPHLATRVAPAGGAVVPMPRPPGSEPPSLMPREGSAHEFAPLVETYATVPYEDVNPSVLAGVAYVVMFGMMFADVGHGALLLVAALAIRLQWWSRLQRLRSVWLFLAGAGLSSMVFGALYGEFFGPTKVVPVLWLEPLDHPVPLLGAAIGVGAALLAGAYVLGTVNRFREGGWRLATYAPTGFAGVALFLGLAAVAAGVYFDLGWIAAIGGVVTLGGMVIAYLGLLVEAGGGGSGAMQAGVELFDLVLRLGANLISFARLAAFGLTHAALGAVVWDGTTALWGKGPLGVLSALVLFALGNALAFALEGLVAAVQALRLEYYELFSRVFDSEGRPFRPWHVPLATTEVPC